MQMKVGNHQTSNPPNNWRGVVIYPQLPGVGLMCLAVEPEIGSRTRDVLA